jgi:hypothetical protein
MQLSASLLVILEEHGYVIGYKIVPSDERIHVQQLLKDIWTTENREIITKVVYTDNPKVDKSAILTTFKDCHPQELVDVVVLLDIFHAQNRIVKELRYQHPDYKAAKQELSKIFAKIQQPNSYPQPEDLVNDFDAWITKFSIVDNALALEINDKIKYLSIIFDFKIDFKKVNFIIKIENQKQSNQGTPQHALLLLLYKSRLNYFKNNPIWIVCFILANTSIWALVELDLMNLFILYLVERCLIL